MTISAVRRIGRGMSPRIGALLVTLVLLVVVMVLLPWSAPFSASEIAGRSDQAPDLTHLFGTDSAGMDVYSRVVLAWRTDIAIGAFATVIATAVGVAAGVSIGLFEGSTGPMGALSQLLGRALDLFQAIPVVIVGILLLAFAGPTIAGISLVLGLVLMPVQARVVRAETTRIRGEAYIDAARLAGESGWAITVRHVVPNASWPAIENATLIFAMSIVLAAGLGVLGVGLAPTEAEWGVMIASGIPSASSGRWWPALFPSLALASTVIAATFIGRRFLHSIRS